MGWWNRWLAGRSLGRGRRATDAIARVSGTRAWGVPCGLPHALDPLWREPGEITTPPRGAGARGKAGGVGP